MHGRACWRAGWNAKARGQNWRKTRRTVDLVMALSMPMVLSDTDIKTDIDAQIHIRIDELVLLSFTNATGSLNNRISEFRPGNKAIYAVFESDVFSCQMSSSKIRISCFRVDLRGVANTSRRGLMEQLTVCGAIRSPGQQSLTNAYGMTVNRIGRHTDPCRLIENCQSSRESPQHGQGRLYVHFVYPTKFGCENAEQPPKSLLRNVEKLAKFDS